MLTPLQNYFHYSRGERRGTFILLIIIILLLLVYFVRDLTNDKEKKPLDEQAFNQKIAAFETQKQKLVLSDSLALFVFDPNQIGVEEWMLLGFTEKQAQSIENYKASGAVFKIKKDVLKLFMVDEYKYAQLEPYIDLPEDYPSYNYSNSTYQSDEPEKNEVFAILIAESDQPIYSGLENYENVHYTKKNGKYQYLLMPYEAEVDAQYAFENLGFEDGAVVQLSSSKGYYPISQKTSSTTEFVPLSIDLNQADTTELKELKGIGSVYAKRIVNYREALGGYISLDQLSEVYGLKEETIEKILPSLYLGDFDVKKMDVNKVTINDLKAHPYIDWKVANSIVQIRNNYGKFASVDGITKSVLIDEALFQKLKPYLEAK